jgi:6-pyruvoyltetrahydropterin/6-carboxytetrahydropterin synthase
MVRLTREVRLTIPPSSEYLKGRVGNSWGGWPVSDLLLPAVRVQLTLEGEVDGPSGYLCNIRTIDEAVRGCLAFATESFANDSRPPMPLTAVDWLNFFWGRLVGHFPKETRLIELALCPSPWQSWKTSVTEYPMILLTRQYEFSAAHRLHNPQLADSANRQLFGKCNNPLGHGHNYVVEVSILMGEENLAKSAGESVTGVLDERVRTNVVDRLDHRHLNEEIEEFRKLNPTVENIAVVVWKWLKEVPLPGQLKNVRVYETPKTWADHFEAVE